MELEQTFLIDHPRREVWAYFGDVVAVTSCMPGASVMEAPADGPIAFELTVRLGPMAAVFTGEAELERDEENYRAVIRGSGRDQRSQTRARGAVEYALLDEEPGHSTRVNVSIQYTLAGALAQFSRGAIVDDLVARLTREFAGNLQRQITAAGSEARADDGRHERHAAAAQPPSGEIRAAPLLASILLERIKRFFRALFARRRT